jgi:hypothetical protein
VPFRRDILWKIIFEKSQLTACADSVILLVVAVICETLNTGRSATDGLNRFVRCTRRLAPAGPKPAGITGRKIR